MLKIDGSFLEGGGQIVRTSVALSAITKKTVEIINIRKGRENPGLKNQHLHLIKALQELCNAEVEGLKLGSSHLIFKPEMLKSKNLNINIGTAGSITLLLQGLLLPCFFLEKPVKITIRGGTCTKWSMPFEFLDNVLLPQLSNFCEKIVLKQEKRGYYPEGGGKVVLKIKPGFVKKTINKTTRGELVMIKGISHASKSLEKSKVGERQARVAKDWLKKFEVPVKINVEYSDTLSVGSGITLWAVFEDEIGDSSIILGADSLGEKGKKAEVVGYEAAKSLIKEVNSGACVDKYSCDNLIPWLAFTGGRIKTSEVTKHSLTNIYVVENFLGKKFEVKNNIISLFQPV